MGGGMCQKVYVLFVGRRPGVYEAWYECQAQVNGLSGVVYQSFPNRALGETAYAMCMQAMNQNVEEAQMDSGVVDSVTTGSHPFEIGCGCGSRGRVEGKLLTGRKHCYELVTVGGRKNLEAGESSNSRGLHKEKGHVVKPMPTVRAEEAEGVVPAEEMRPKLLLVIGFAMAYTILRLELGPKTLPLELPQSWPRHCFIWTAKNPTQPKHLGIIA